MVEFQYQGMSFPVSEEVGNYAAVRLENLVIREKVRDAFLEMYHGYHSMDTAMERMPDDLHGLLYKVINMLANRWIERGALDLTTDIFIRDYYMPLYHGNSLAVDSVYDQIMDAYSNIIMTQEQKAQYRTMRKNMRGRWTGGGFGLSGAIAGAATAGMLNAASGIGHGIFNAIGNIGSSWEAKEKKRKLYENPDTVGRLLQALSDDAFNILLANTDCGSERFGIEYKPRYEEESERANAILGNLEKLQVEGSKFKEMMGELFELDPYNIRFYRLALSRFGYEKKELQSMAGFFGCGRELNAYKNQLLEDMALKPESEDLAGYQKLLEELKPKAQYYGIDEASSPVFKKVQDNYNRLETEARIFEATTYSSIQEAEAAKAEKQELEHIFSGISLTEKKSIWEGLLQLRDYPVERYPKKSYLEEVERALKNEIINSVDSLDKASILKAQEELSEAGFQEISVEKEIGDLEEKLKNFDTNFRTVDGVLYSSDEEARAAREELKYCEDTLNAVDIDDEASISSAMEKLRSHSFQYIHVNEYLEKIEQVLEALQVEMLPEKIERFLERRDFSGAWQFLRTVEVPEDAREKEKKLLNQNAKRMLSEELKQAEEYKDTGMGNTLLGAVLIVVIGIFLTAIFPLAFPIAVIISILGIIGNLGRAKERKEWKKAFDLISELKRIGYTF